MAEISTEGARNPPASDGVVLIGQTPTAGSATIYFWLARTGLASLLSALRFSFNQAHAGIGNVDTIIIGDIFAQAAFDDMQYKAKGELCDE